MKKSRFITVFIFVSFITLSALILTSCATFDRVANWPIDKNAPVWAVDFGAITSINTQTVMDRGSKFFWTADRVIAILGQKALAAVYLYDDKKDFALTYRTNHPKYSHVTIVFRTENRRQMYGYLDFDIHKDYFPLMAAVANGEMIEAWKSIKSKKLYRETQDRKSGV